LDGHIRSVRPPWGTSSTDISLYAALWFAGQWDEDNSNDCGLL